MLLLQVAAAVGVSGEHRGGGHAPSSLGPPLRGFVRAAVCRQHFSVMGKGIQEVSLQQLWQTCHKLRERAHGEKHGKCLGGVASRYVLGEF